MSAICCEISEPCECSVKALKKALVLPRISVYFCNFPGDFHSWIFKLNVSVYVSGVAVVALHHATRWRHWYACRGSGSGGQLPGGPDDAAGNASSAGRRYHGSTNTRSS